jgi:hypothetical protein
MSQVVTRPDGRKVLVAKPYDQLFVISQGDIVEFLANHSSELEENTLNAIAMSEALAKGRETDPNQPARASGTRVRYSLFGNLINNKDMSITRQVT